MFDKNSMQQRIHKARQLAPYYPDYHEYEETDGTYNITCLVRHYHNGTWYVQHHYQYGNITKRVKPEHIRRQFLRDIYLHLKFGVIDPELKEHDGHPLFEVDTIQISEKERLLG